MSVLIAGHSQVKYLNRYISDHHVTCISNYIQNHSEAKVLTICDAIVCSSFSFLVLGAVPVPVPVPVPGFSMSPFTHLIDLK